MTRIFSRICECEICGREEVAVRAVLPDEWIITWDTSTTICDKCLARWIERWGKEPIVYLRGGEKELILL